MNSMLKNVLSIKMTTSANTFVYYFKRIWLIGKLLPDRVYADSDLKSVLSWLVAVFIQSYKFIAKAFYVGLVIFLPLFFVYEEDVLKLGLPGFVHMFFILNLLFGSFQESEIFKVTNEKLICLKYMRMNPKSYLRATVGLKYALDFLYFFPSIMLSVLLLGGGFLNGLSLCVMLIAFRFIFEAIHLKVYDLCKMVIPRKYVIIYIGMALCAVAAYLPTFMQMPLYTMQVILSLPFVLGTLIVGGLCFYYVMFRYPHYKTTLTRSMDVKFSYQYIRQNAKASQFNDVKMKDKDTKQIFKQDKYHAKAGYSYLNAIFFDRHQRQIIKPVLMRVAIVALTFVAFAVGLILQPDQFRSAAVSMTNMLPIFVFGMYCLSTGNKACRAMFYNCDIALLRYGFYRKPSVIIKNFQTRLFRIAGYDLLTGCTVSLAVVAIVKIAGIDWDFMSMVSFVATILLLSLFFTVHHLFMYYVFQPYTTELNVKNPFFSLINTVIYVLCFVCLQIESGNGLFTLIVLFSTIVYIIIALLSVYKFSSKTFRVK